MKFNRSQLFLYGITNPSPAGSPWEEAPVEEALAAGITLLQLREKNISPEEYLARAIRAHRLAQRYGVPLLINDSVDIAIRSGADGVHVGQGDMPAKEARRLLGPGRILGVTVKTPEQAVRAYEDGADYLGCGAIFPTSTKEDAAPMPLETLSAICAAVPIPAVAIGGLNSTNLDVLAGSGVAGAAIVSAIFGAPGIPAAVRLLKERLKEVIAL